MVGVSVFAADTDAEARRQFTSVQQAFLNLVRGRPREIPPPVETMDGLWSGPERFQVERMTRCSAVGSPGAVRRQLAAIAGETGADELILATQAYDHAARLRSFELAAGCFERPTGHERPAVRAPGLLAGSRSSSWTAPAVQGGEPRRFVGTVGPDPPPGS
jgi:hypothetical protein